MGVGVTVGSLFAGIGGFDLGFERAGFEIRWQVEIDDYASRVLARHWPGVARYGDIRVVDSWLTFEKGETDPTLRTFEKIAEALELSPVELARLCVQAAQHADAAGGECRSTWEGGA